MDKRGFLKTLLSTAVAGVAATRMVGRAEARLLDDQPRGPDFRMDRFAASQIKAMLLKLDVIRFPPVVTQLQHALQTATRAVHDRADEELVMIALCHDLGKVFDITNHEAIGAEILRTHVSLDRYEIVRCHTLFNFNENGPMRADGPAFIIEGPGASCFFPPYLCGDSKAHERFQDRPWYATARKFALDWDSKSFDPNFESLPLSYFEPIIDRITHHITYSFVKRGPAKVSKGE